jgi:hypothetical protein
MGQVFRCAKLEIRISKPETNSNSEPKHNELIPIFISDFEIRISDFAFGVLLFLLDCLFCATFGGRFGCLPGRLLLVEDRVITFREVLRFSQANPHDAHELPRKPGMIFLSLRILPLRTLGEMF